MKNSIQLVLSSSKTIDFFDPMTLCDKQHTGFPLAILSFCSKITFCPVGTHVHHSGATYDNCIVVAETILSHFRVGVKPLCYVHVCDIQCLSCTHLLCLLTSGFMPPKHL